jgi:hypothetical protein
MRANMKNVDIEDMVIADLKKNATTLLKVLDRDTQSALRAKDPDVMTAINVNLRTLTAINEVLMYYGDAGVFNED